MVVQGCTMAWTQCTMVQVMCTMVYHCLPWYTTVHHGIPLFTMIYHCSPWYTMVVPWYLFIRERIVVISLGLVAQYNKTEEKILIIIFTEWQMMFKSMHQCSKNQMAQYLAMAVQYFNYWSSLNARHCNFSHFCLYIYITHLCHGAKLWEAQNVVSILTILHWYLAVGFIV